MEVIQPTLKITIMTENEFFDLYVREEQTLEEFKSQIERYLGHDSAFYYVFYNNANLSDNYNSMQMGKILKHRREKEGLSKMDSIFYVVNIDQYKKLLSTIGCTRCEFHQFNTAYLFCEQCQELICDQCKIEKHNDHEIISDQANVMLSYFRKSELYERAFSRMFSKNLKVEINSHCQNMKASLESYYNQEEEAIKNLANEVKGMIDEISKLEIERLKKFIDTGYAKIKSIKKDSLDVFNMYEDSKSGMSKDITYSEFSNSGLNKKIEIIKKVQRQNLLLVNSSKRIESILERHKHYQDYAPHHLFENNKDNSYLMTFTKLKQILTKKLNQNKIKCEEENTSHILKSMEELVQQKQKIEVYNDLLNLANLEQDNIYQVIEGTNSIHIFNIPEKKISRKEIKMNCEGLTVFPTFCRSITIMGKLYVSGGEVDNNVTGLFIEVDPGTETAVMKKTMDNPRAGHTMVNIANIRIFVISGAYGQRSCEFYEIESSTWKSIGKLNQDRIGPSVLVHQGETLYVFFGKRWDSSAKKWVFLESIEKIFYSQRYSEWVPVNFKATDIDLMKSRAFSSVIACPNGKIFLLGGQIFEEGRLQCLEDVLELNITDHNIGRSSLQMPFGCTFLDSNFYFHNSNAVQFDNEGNVMFFSSIFQEMWLLDNF